MRNMFKKVSCEDCEFIILSQFAEPDWPTRLAECKQKIYRLNDRIGRKVKPEYYGCSMRKFPFCFWFRKKR